MPTFKELINKYFYSERLSGDIDGIVISAIFGRYGESLYELEIEFEPVGSIGSGDSWVWRTTEISEEQIRQFIYHMLAIDLLKIKSLPEREKFNTTPPVNISQQCTAFDIKYQSGRLLLPQLPPGVHWRLWPGKHIDFTQ